MNTDLNRQALNAVDQCRWRDAQELLYKYVRKTPCHKSYHNLGYYLLINGRISPNGAYRNADKVAVRYLTKAAEYDTTAANRIALAMAVDILQEKHSGVCDPTAYRTAFLAMQEAHEIEPSYESMYNKIRYLYLSEPQNDTILNELRSLVDVFPCYESIWFFCWLLMERGLADECLQYMDMYQSVLSEDDMDRMILYYKCGAYEKCSALYEPLHDKWVFRVSDAAFMVDSLIKTGDVEAAYECVQNCISFYSECPNSQIKSKCKCFKDMLSDDVTLSTKNRLKLIEKYSVKPQIIHQNCFLL